MAGIELSRQVIKEQYSIYNGDCMETMKSMPDGSVDMILTDPPYEISNIGGGMMLRDNREFIREIDAMGMCVSGFDVAAFLNETVRLFPTDQHYNGVFFCSMKQVSSYLAWAESRGYQHGLGVWHKTNPAPLCNNKYLSDVEYWIYIKGKSRKIHGDYHSKSMVYQSKINASDKKLYEHPTIKPLDLVKKFVVNHTVEGDVIFDPFSGSGSTGVAALEMGRKFIGVELDEKHFQTTINRIEGTDNVTKWFDQ